MPVGLGKAQAQAVVMRHQRRQGMLQRLSLQRLTDLQQHGLIPVLRVNDLAVEEPSLDWRQGAAALPSALLDAALRLATADHGGERLDSLVLEQIARGELQAQLAGATDHLNRQNRVAPNSKKLSCTPMRATLSTSCQTCASCCSSSLAGA